MQVHSRPFNYVLVRHNACNLKYIGYATLYTSLENFRGNFEDTKSSVLVIPMKRESLKVAPTVSFNFSCKHAMKKKTKNPC
jgi:hypothetical protein